MLSPQADAIFIPMMNSIILSVILLPIISIVTWICIRGIDGVGDLLAWDRQRPIRSSLVTVCFGLPFCFNLLSLANDLSAPKSWYGIWWLPYTLVTLLWLAAMRGAALTKRPVR